METFTFPHLPLQKSGAQFALFRNVENAANLRQRIVQAPTLQGRKGEIERNALNLAFIDARLITSRLHLRTAIHQAILADSTTPSSLRTRSVNSEILFYLNPTNNITEAFRNYGLSDTSTDLIVVRVGSHTAALNAVQELMKDVVIGTIVPFPELQNITDWGRVKRYLKLNGEVALKGKSGEQEQAIIDKIVTSSVAMKSVMQ